jgi:hypothetical protein
MKIRKGFVSNSSSTAFICLVCGATESGMDMGIEDAEMAECKKGHVFCQSHSPTLTNDEKVAWYLEYDKDLSEEERKEILENPDDIDEHISRDYGISELLYSYPKCPICSMESFTDTELLRFMLAESNISLKELEAKVRGKFNSFDEFIKFLEEKEKN